MLGKAVYIWRGKLQVALGYSIPILLSYFHTMFIEIVVEVKPWRSPMWRTIAGP